MTASSLLPRPPPPSGSHSNGTPPRQKPQILACAAPITGHTLPIIKLVHQLTQRGYPVTMLAGAEFRDRVQDAGASFLGVAPFDLAALQAHRQSLDTWAEKTAYALQAFCLEPRERRTKEFYAALEHIRERHPRDEVVVLVETFFLGDHALFLGAPLPRGFARRPPSINIHAMPYVMRSVDMGPVGCELVPPGTGREEARRVYEAQWEMMRHEVLPHVVERQQGMLRELGAVEARPALPLDLVCSSADAIIQMCPPSLEFDIPDRHPKVRFAGALPGTGPDEGFRHPSFWADLTRRERHVVVVVVTQGTVAVNYDHLIIPTLKALARREHLLVVAILGRRGACLADDVVVPRNTRVVDYLPYDAILPLASVFVTNAGYGGFIHGVLNGVPMVLAGETEEKPEVAARGEHAGVAVNLRTGTPGVEQIAEAVDRVLRDEAYKKRVEEIRRENESMDTMGIIESTIVQLAGGGEAED